MPNRPVTVIPYSPPIAAAADAHGELARESVRISDLARAALRISESRYRRLFEAAQDGILLLNADTAQIEDVNPYLIEMLGYSHEEFLGKKLWEVGPFADITQSKEMFAELQTNGYVRYEDLPLKTKAGGRVQVEFVSNSYDCEGIKVIQCNIRNITERKWAEEALARESHRNQVFLRNASDGVHILDADGNVLEVSDSFCNMLGYSRAELIGANVSLWDAQLSPQELKESIAEQTAKKGRSIFQTQHRRRDGSVFDVEVTGQGLELDGKTALFNSARDITKRIRATRELVESETRFRSLVEQAIAGIYIIQDDKFVYVNPRAAEIVGHGSADELIGTDPLLSVAEADRGIVAENIRRLLEGEVQSVTLDFAVVRRDGVEIQVGANAARATHEGRPALIGLLQDISVKKRDEARIQDYIGKLKTAFESTVAVVATLSEIRDPYTHGHERRVGEIAAAIADEMGLDADRVEGIRVAGHMHDVGKISVPVEILCKPTKLSPTEFKLVMCHAQQGYDILKGIEFPWPVAEVALQHHERLDGSGYPQGLKGDAILLEARVVSVADVVEAMSSHRPYRPGRGIEKALLEIEQGSGTLYDPVVAGVCLSLFRDKGYTIPV